MKLFSTKLILLFLCIEILLRLFSCLLPSWYRLAAQDVQNVPVKYIFIGSSRVAASIVPKVFIQATGENNPPDSAINMGAGYSTLVEHYFGLKRIAAAMPDGMKGVTVFLEAPMGVPVMTTWYKNWLNSTNPLLLVNTIRITDLLSFWSKDDSNFDLKVKVTAGTLSEVIAMQGSGQQLATRIKKLILQNRNGIASEKGDLSSSGGIRTDDVEIQNSRRYAVSLAAYELKHEQLFPSQCGDETVLKSLNDFIIASGGRLILYCIPLSSVQEKVYTTSIGRENREIVHGLLETWSIPMLYPNISTNDDDFPDYWHLRKSRSSEFTRSLARAYRELDGNNI